MEYAYTTTANSLQAIDPSVRPSAVRLKDGFAAQVYVGNEIVWESKFTSATQEDAYAKAVKRIHKTYKRIFGGK